MDSLVDSRILKARDRIVSIHKYISERRSLLNLLEPSALATSYLCSAQLLDFSLRDPIMRPRHNLTGILFHEGSIITVLENLTENIGKF